jgi:hypothetical protein
VPNAFEELAMVRSTLSTHASRAFAETVVPAAVCERCSQTMEFDREPSVEEELDRELALERRRVVHFAIRIGKSFEFVVECCQL